MYYLCIQNTGGIIILYILFLSIILLGEDWQSDRMRWTRNPVYSFTGIGGLNPSSSAM